MFVGTDQSNIYWVDVESLTAELRNTCHFDRINYVRAERDCVQRRTADCVQRRTPRTPETGLAASGAPRTGL